MVALPVFFLSVGVVQRRQNQAASAEEVPRSLSDDPITAVSHDEAGVFEPQSTSAETLEPQDKSDKMLVLELTEELRKKVTKNSCQYKATHSTFFIL